MRAAFLSARNDALANIALIAAALVTVIHPSAWPDLVAGRGIMALNANARVKYRARPERNTASLMQQNTDKGTTSP